MKTTWRQDGAVLTARVFDGLVSVRVWVSEEHVLATAVFSGDASLRIEARGVGAAMVEPMEGHAITTAFELALAELGYPTLEPPGAEVLGDVLAFAMRRAALVWER